MQFNHLVGNYEKMEVKEKFHAIVPDFGFYSKQFSPDVQKAIIKQFIAHKTRDAYAIFDIIYKMPEPHRLMDETLRRLQFRTFAKPTEMLILAGMAYVLAEQRGSVVDELFYNTMHCSLKLPNAGCEKPGCKLQFYKCNRIHNQDVYHVVPVVNNEDTNNCPLCKKGVRGDAGIFLPV